MHAGSPGQCHHQPHGLRGVCKVRFLQTLPTLFVVRRSAYLTGDHTFSNWFSGGGETCYQIDAHISPASCLGAQSSGGTRTACFRTSNPDNIMLLSGFGSEAPDLSIVSAILATLVFDWEVSFTSIFARGRHRWASNVVKGLFLGIMPSVRMSSFHTPIVTQTQICRTNAARQYTHEQHSAA